MICTRHFTSSCVRQRYTSLILRSVSTFSAQRKIMQRNRAAALPNNTQYDYLKDGIAEILADRITDIKRDFKTMVDLGCGKGHVYKHVNEYVTSRLIECDTVTQCLNKQRDKTAFELEQVVLKEECKLPFESDSIDLVISNLWMHWVNNLPLLLKEVNRVLIPDGVFLGAMFASDTAYQLRVSLQQAEQERTGGISAHVSPFVTPQDIGALLHNAGYCMITLDCEEFTITYPDLYFLLRDIQGMGENSCLLSQPSVLRRDVLLGAGAIYNTLYGAPDGALPLTYNVLYFIAWKQSRLQGRPKPRGSQTASLRDLDAIIGGQKKP